MASPSALGDGLRPCPARQSRRPASGAGLRTSDRCRPGCLCSTTGGRGRRCPHRAPSGSGAGGCRTASTRRRRCAGLEASWAGGRQAAGCSSWSPWVLEASSGHWPWRLADRAAGRGSFRLPAQRSATHGERGRLRCQFAVLEQGSGSCHLEAASAQDLKDRDQGPCRRRRTLAGPEKGRSPAARFCRRSRSARSCPADRAAKDGHGPNRRQRPHR